ncbi:MAG: O-antigen ligase family protein, partial [Solirubrobacterales bacterium]
MGAALASIALGAGITLNVQIPFLIVITFLGVLGLARLGATLSRLPVGQRRFMFLWCALVASTFVWRIRTTTQLDTNPLDAAGMVRVAWIALAVLLLLAWLPVLTRADRRMPLPLRFLGLYVVVALLSAALSPLPFQALYRVSELAVGLAAILAAPRLLGGKDVGERLLTVLVATIGVILTVAWLEAIVMPSQAWTHLYYYGFIPWTLGGVIPQFSSNTLGMLGALLALWGLSMPRGNFFRGDTAVALILGVATLVATGYRTGLIGFLLAGALILWLQRRVGLTLLAGSAAIAVVAIFGASGLQATGQQAISHGQTGSQISSLDSRTFYWNEAQVLVKERPVLG